VQPQIIRGAILYEAGFAVDADGSPHAYALPGSGLRGLDHIDNAGHRGRWLGPAGKVVIDPEILESLRGLESNPPPGYRWQPRAWWGVVCNAAGTPVEQGPGDPAPGFCVSSTSLVDPRFGERDPRRYVDSERVPYAAVPPDLTGGRGVRMGDVAVAIYRGKVAGCIVADVGPSGHYGEGSIALADDLGIAGRGQCRGRGLAWGVTWAVFPGSHAAPAWPREVADVQGQAVRMFAEWGGVAAVPWMAPGV
jgi:hypothetical protein